MTWTPPPRTPASDAAHAAAEADRAARPHRYDLGTSAVDAVTERALRGADPSSLGDPSDWRDGLVAYLGSAAEDGRLNAIGQRMVLDTAVSKLRARLAMDALLTDDPSVASRPLAAPIVIVGGWRTGTTFLFRLLATDPRLRAPLPAELGAPWRFSGLTGDEREALIDAGQAAHDLLHLLNPGLAAVHSSGARLPEECVLAMGTDLRNWGFSSTIRLDAYSDWLLDQDLTGSYRRYADVLRALDAQDGRRWVIKAPAHTAELERVATAFPGATIVFLHRDIVETVASGASLFATFRSSYSDDVDPGDVGRFMLEQTERWLRRAEAFTMSTAARSVTILDISYRQLVADAAGVVNQICEISGMDAPADVAGLVDDYHRSQPRNAHGSHRYSPEEFGLDPDAVRERTAFHQPEL